MKSLTKALLIGGAGAGWVAIVVAAGVSGLNRENSIYNSRPCNIEVISQWDGGKRFENIMWGDITSSDEYIRFRKDGTIYVWSGNYLLMCSELKKEK